MERLSSFKAYDIRGKVPSELNGDLAYKIGRTYPVLVNAQKIVIGHDIRKSSEEISAALVAGLTESGVDVIDIGLCGTEMVYYATPALEADGGIMITASHNPPEYNGMKFVKKGSVPVGYDSGLKEMEKMILRDELAPKSTKQGTMKQLDIMYKFINNLKRFYDAKKIKKYKVVVNAGNGCAGLALNALEKDLPIEMIKVFNEPDSDFPNGVPNPLLIENRKPTIDAILKSKADLGVAWDGDYDRCFFFDEKGNFIEGYYIVGLLAKSILKKNPGGKIVHDPRLTWNTLEIVNKFGGQAVVSKSGHAFIKQKMRKVNSVYGGEMSAHHYFRDNAYSDSGMIPFVLILQLMSEENKPFSQLVEEMIAAYPCSGEINSEISDPAGKIKEIEKKYSDGKIDKLDGLSVEYDNWRFNLRMSNTEPIIRLNVEAKGSIKLMEEKTKELLNLIRN
ncbi:MAG: phosphomannomutase [Ignavibacteria bacterium RIFOXYB2_FULL_35_12]|nr:MAG: phosphomannomutase [Ignavibacteria bacterium GWA2_36_19]OGU54360.1 MAG: phosphomannomutase [Ignavibacteria bacterium GWC2_35_8]OGU62118.1 MAG: phosphomannomutase [Ignavibacteria bacterium GWF2_35_20]OGU79742.1 MAG: phosphomannomutase [Ignavibacteria bacterium RIFOXYA2_FULL_35_9]OGU87692.1 MAG: phosphomannomutase [Ignavibacteria bacterium RIFOXYA12_FULL_35_25]OGU89846.1 MAG: phosphomannomutase [Ignavibacteria bacterium RIFOXYC12_FULL_35_11]OGU96550.1 MAG: phosphomannomutase [Ignavibact